MAAAINQGERMNYDVMYIDGDERNAADRDHRTQQGSRPAGWGNRPGVPTGSSGTRTVVVPPSRNPTVIHTSQPAPVPSAYAPGYYRPGMLVAQPPSFASRFGMSTGELIDTAIQILAAIQPLPGAPTAQGEAGVDVENLVTYQGALATHAKRDEQLRTLGNLLVRILK
jgi:hypothetical protein